MKKTILKSFAIVLPVLAVVVLTLYLSGFNFLSIDKILAEGQDGTTLTAEVSASSSWQIIYGWTIAKTVSPGVWNLFKGDRGTSEFTIGVVKDNGTETAQLQGEVCVTNGGAVDTTDLAISADLKSPPSKIVISTSSVDVSSHPVLLVGETVCYPYAVIIPADKVVAGDTYKVTAHVTITDHSGSLGAPFGPSPSTTAILPASPALVNDEVNVTDSNGSSWLFGTSSIEKYTKQFACDADLGFFENTATITETGQQASTSVEVKCYGLEITDPINTSFKRTYAWQIGKTVTPTSLTLATGEQLPAAYSVNVSSSSVDSDWQASGQVIVANPAPMSATIAGIEDVVTVGIPVVLNCGVTFPYALPASTSLACSYTVALPDAATRISRATVTLQNFDYDALGFATSSGTTAYAEEANIDFTGVLPREVDKCITLSDTFVPDLGSVCYGETPRIFSYSHQVGPYASCGDYTVANTAAFTTADTQTSGSAAAAVSVSVPCKSGCTLTPGYWKNHSGYGPAPYDDAWKLLLPNGEDSAFYQSGQSWYDVLKTPPKGGNAYYILAHAYTAAKLNILNGAATTPAVVSAMTGANTFFGTYGPTATLSKSLRNTILGYANLLDQYNNGNIGPGHCSE